jgi:hypothetical protein
LRRCIHQQAAHLCRRIQQGCAAVRDGVTAGGQAFVGGEAGVGGEKVDQRRRHVQLLRRDLQQGGAHAGTEFHLAGEHRHLAVRRDLDPRVEQRVRLQAAGEQIVLLADLHCGAFVGDHFLRQRIRARHQSEADDQRARQNEAAASLVDLIVLCAHCDAPVA